MFLVLYFGLLKYFFFVYKSVMQIIRYIKLFLNNCEAHCKEIITKLVKIKLSFIMAMMILDKDINFEQIATRRSKCLKHFFY